MSSLSTVIYSDPQSLPPIFEKGDDPTPTPGKKFILGDSSLIHLR